MASSLRDLHHAQIAVSSMVSQGSAADFLCDKDVQFYDSVSIVMPLRVASADITALCDSICAYAFDSKPGTSVMAAAATWMRTRPSEGGYKAVSASADRFQASLQHPWGQWR